MGIRTDARISMIFHKTIFATYNNATSLMSKSDFFVKRTLIKIYNIHLYNVLYVHGPEV